MQPPSREQRSAEAQRLLEGVNGPWVARRLGVSDATVSAWRRGDPQRAPDLGMLLAVAIAVGRPLDPELDRQATELLEAARVALPVAPAVIEAAAREAKEIAEHMRQEDEEDPSAGARRTGDDASTERGGGAGR